METNDSIGLERIDFEVSNLKKLSKRQRFKCETINIAFVSLLLGMSTAVSLINVVIPLGFTGLNVGFTLKYFVIAISFQVVGIYWGMIIGLLDGLLQFIIFGLSPLFRLTSALGLVLWVLIFWLFYKVIFRYYEQESKQQKIIRSLASSTVILLLQPFISTVLYAPNIILQYGTAWFNIFWTGFALSYVAFLPFYFFSILIFTLTTDSIHLIMKRYIRD